MRAPDPSGHPARPARRPDPGPVRLVLAVTASGVLVAAPLLGAHRSARLAVSLVTTTSTAADLLGALAAVATSALLFWLAMQAIAGVGHAWGELVDGRSPIPTSRPPGRARLRERAVTVAVAACVASLLGSQSASAAAAPGPVTAVHRVLDAASDGPAAPGAETAPDEAAGTAAVPGSWTSLASGAAAPEPPATDGRGFVVPTGAPARAVGLVSAAERRPSQQAAEVVVTAGDNLWSIVRTHLGPDATDLEVARTWPSWWEANRAVIGGDPDLLRPGQRLVVPVA